jgi:hypothetical protein
LTHLREESGGSKALCRAPSMRSQSVPTIDACLEQGALPLSALHEIVTSNREQAKFG